MARYIVITLAVIILASIAQSCGCGCTPPMGLNFVVDSAGRNITARYTNPSVQYSLENQISSVLHVQLLMNNPIVGYSETGVIDAMSTIQLAVSTGVSEFRLTQPGKEVAAFTLKAHKELFDGKYVIDELKLNGQKLTPLSQAMPNTYVIRLY